MIRKFIIVGRQLYLQNEHPEALDDNNKPVELLLPVDELWKLNKMLKETDYLLASNEPRGDIKIARNKILDFVQPYAVAEKDRMWLIGLVDRGDEL
jgi:hypothetical protein